MLAFSVGVYDTLKFVHILAAIIWVGAGLFFQFHATRLQRSNDPVKFAGFAKDVEFYGLRLFTPASLLVLLTGIAMVLYSPGLDFSDTWIWLGLVGYAITFLTGATYLGPASGRLGKMIDTRSPDDPEVQAGIRRIFTISRVDQTVILLVVADMVFKPGL
ncbi:MAG: DUF2269 family protein [Actinomycetota bacterium]